MSNDPNPHDEIIDKVLAALRDAVPPEGIEARITHRLVQNPTPANRSTHRWRYRLTGSAVAGAWWRGAIAGAATALLTVGVFFLAAHLLQTNSTPQVAKLVPSQGSSIPAVILAHNPINSSAAEAQTDRCTSHAVLRLPTATPSTSQRLRAETRIDTTAPSHPAPALPLTAEERELVQIARTGDPKTLATINPETQAKLQAQESAEFEKFFAPTPVPPAAGSHE